MSSSDEDTDVGTQMFRSQTGRNRVSSHSMDTSLGFKRSNKTESTVLSGSDSGKTRASSNSLDAVINFTRSEQTGSTLMSESQAGKNRTSSRSLDKMYNFTGSKATERPLTPSVTSHTTDNSSVFILDSELFCRSPVGGSTTRASSRSLGTDDKHDGSKNPGRTPFYRSSSLRSVSNQSVCSLSLVPELLDEEDRPFSSTSSDSGIATSTDSSSVSMLMAKKLRAVIPPSAGPGDVACDFCTGSKCKAWKSCLNCVRSFCEKHVRDHYKYKEMDEHQLVEVTADLNVYKQMDDLKQDIRKLSEENRTLREKINTMNPSTITLPAYISEDKTPTAADVVLDPATAHRTLLITERGKRVRMTRRTSVQPGTLRFDRWECVLAKNGFSSGRHYWQVEVNKEFVIGVMKSSGQRNGRFTFAPFQGFWCIFHFWLSFSALEDRVLRLPIKSVPRVLGVCVDVDEKWVTFYNAETKEEVYTFRKMKLAPGEQVYPIFRTVDKSMDLVLTP